MSNGEGMTKTWCTIRFVILPLGWMLSNGPAEAMQKEMFDSGLSAKAPVPTWNQSVLKQIVAELHGETH